MALTTRQTQRRWQNCDDPRFGFLMAGCDYFESVGTKIEEPAFPPKECAGTFTAVYVAPQHGTLSPFITRRGAGGLIRSVVYQPTSATPVLLEEFVYSALRSNANTSALRRKVSGFSHLPHNWDGEGAEPTSEDTINTSMRVVEQIAVVLERKNTSSLPSVRPFPDGSVFFRLICGQKELAITVENRNVEVQRWQPLDAFQSQGLWEISVDAIPEHVDWALT
jgi:hypothetical protein